MTTRTQSIEDPNPAEDEDAPAVHCSDPSPRTSEATLRPKAKTFDAGKAPLATVPRAAIDEIAHVQAYGHEKYGDFHNYRKGMEVTRNLSCALRHIRDYLNGNDADEESGRHPLGHAITRLAFVLQNIHDGTAIDDRFRA